MCKDKVLDMEGAISPPWLRDTTAWVQQIKASTPITYVGR